MFQFLEEPLGSFLKVLEGTTLFFLYSVVAEFYTAVNVMCLV